MVTPAPESGPGAQLAQLALSLVSRDTSPRLRRALFGYAVAAASVQVGRKWWKKFRETTTCTVTVRATDEIYGDVHAWLLERIPPSRRSSLTAKSRRRADEIELSSSMPIEYGDDKATLGLLYNGGHQRITLNGHRITVHVSQPDIGAWAAASSTGMNWLLDREEIVFTATTPEGRDAIVVFLREIADAHYHGEHRPSFFLGSKWGDWRRRRDISRRHLDSVVLRAGQVDSIRDDMADFLSRRDDYGRLGMPWHRGYLFEGPAGTGKTSLARALASHFEMDVYFVPLSDIENDNSLLQLIVGIEPRSMLLLEDIDVVRAARERADDTGVTTAGLLNALDGISTPNGLITVMTTNDATRIEPALLRPGRVDMTQHIGLLDQRQFEQLVTAFLDIDQHGLPCIPVESVAPAHVVDVIKRHLDDPEGALIEFKERYSAKGGHK